MFCSHCGARNDDANRFCDQCGTPLTVVPQPVPQPVAQPQQPVYQQPVPQPVAQPQQPVYQQPQPPYQPAPAYQPAPVYAPAPVYSAPAAPAPKARPLVGVIVVTGIAMLLQFLHLCTAAGVGLFGGNVDSSPVYYLLTFTALTLFLVSAIIPNWKLRGILGGIGALTMSVEALILSINIFTFVDELAGYSSSRNALYLEECLLSGILLMLVFIFFLIGGILCFIRLKGRGLRITAGIILLIHAVLNFMNLFMNATVNDNGVRFDTIVFYFATIMTAIAAMIFFSSVKRPA